MFKKLNDIKNKLVELWHKHPHIFVIFLLILLSVVASLANDAYFERVFKSTPIQSTTVVPSKPVYMKILSISPDTGIKQSYDTFMQIHIAFSANIDPVSVKVSSTPAHNIGFEVTGNKVRIYPRMPWEYEVGYLLNIDARSTGGLVLEEPLEYSQYIAIPADGSVFNVY